MILALDPGITTGWAVFTGNGNVLGFGQGTVKELHHFLSTIEKEYGTEPSTVIIEAYTVLPTPRSLKANVGTKVRTAEVIGIIKSFCIGWNCQVIEQAPQAMKIGYMWLGLKQPSDHSISHQYDALAHGQYYLVRNNIVEVIIK